MAKNWPNSAPGPAKFGLISKSPAFLKSGSISAHNINYLGFFVNWDRFYGQKSARHPFSVLISCSKRKSYDCHLFPEEFVDEILENYSGQQSREG